MYKGIRECFSTQKQRSLEKSGDVLKTLLTTKDQRLEAFESIESAKPEWAIPQLLKRLEITVDHGIQDKVEKERVLEFVTKHKSLTKPVILDKIPKSKKISWMLRVSERVLEPEEYLDILLENLRPESLDFDDDALERNIEVLLALKEIKNPKIGERVLPYLKSRHGEVRLAAVECMEAQAQESVELRKVLIEMAGQTKSDENSRLLGVLQTMISKNAWT